ncbi:MAG: hypothetical protein ACRD1F_09375 [Terriglobales bacterium]
MYQQVAILCALERLWLDDPRLPVAACAQAVGIERHTLQRAARRCGTNLTSIRHACLLRAFAQTVRSEPLWSIKEVAVALGYASCSALDHALRRAREDSSGCAGPTRNAPSRPLAALDAN